MEETSNNMDSPRSVHYRFIVMLACIIGYGSLFSSEFSVIPTSTKETKLQAVRRTRIVDSDNRSLSSVGDFIKEEKALLNNGSPNTINNIDGASPMTNERYTPDKERIFPREYRFWPPDKPLPCFPTEENWDKREVQIKPTNEGFLYLKPYKTGSSTVSGINLRIARNVAKRQNKDFDLCKARFDHGPDFTPGKTLFGNRSLENSILWSILRNPTKRATSAFFHFGVSRLGIEPTDDNFKEFITKTIPTKDYYLAALYTEKHFNRTKDNPIQVANKILDEFNFIGITERMDESAVALMMLLNLKLSDILYLSSKTSGGYDDGGGGFGCTLIKPSFVSEGMAEFFKSDEWKDSIKYDLALYKAANKSLDLTIDKLGRELFNANLAKFEEAKKEAAAKCLPTTVFRCDHEGNFHFPSETDCLWLDSGCGTSCLDTVATELGLW